MLLDLTMPDMSGQEVWKKTREEQALLPIVILTGYSAELIPEHMLEDPHTRFLQKPFELSVLLDRISTLV